MVRIVSSDQVVSDLQGPDALLLRHEAGDAAVHLGGQEPLAAHRRQPQHPVQRLVHVRALPPPPVSRLRTRLAISCMQISECSIHPCSALSTPGSGAQACPASNSRMLCSPATLLPHCLARHKSFVRSEWAISVFSKGRAVVPTVNHRRQASQGGTVRRQGAQVAAEVSTGSHLRQ